MDLYQGQRFLCVFVTLAFSFLFVISMQDLDDALPLIHTHKEQLVAIGEVTPQNRETFLLSSLNLQWHFER